MIKDISQNAWGEYRARYIDRFGNVCRVRGTYALGVPLSWYDTEGNYMVICGYDQNRIIEKTETIRIEQ